MVSSSRFVRAITATALLLISVVTVVYEPTAVRPLYLFGVFGLALTILLVPVLTLPKSDLEGAVIPIGGAGVLVGLSFRVTAFDVVISSGIDHYRWVTRVQEMLVAGDITGSDMYASAPFYLLDLAMAQVVADLQPFQTRFVTIIATSITPVVAYLFARRLTGDRRVALATLLVTVPQMLFLRTSALLESEAFAIPWALLALYLLLRYLQTDDTRTLSLFVGLTLLSVFLHFLYALVIFGIAAGTQVLLFLFGRVGAEGKLLTRERVRWLVPANVVVGLLVAAYIVSSSFRNVVFDAVDTVFSGSSPFGGGSSATPTPTPTQTPTADSGRGGSAGGILDGIETTIADVFGSLLPSAGTVGRSVGIEGAVTPLDLAGVLVPVLLFLAFAGVGGLVTLYRRSDTDLFLLAGGLTIGVVSVVAVQLDLLFDVGFRLYYFLATLLVVYAGMGICRASEVQVGGRAALVLVVVLFFGYATVGPVSPVGNNVDPRFGGEQWYLTSDEQAQIQTLDETLGGRELVGTDIPQLSGYLRPSATNGGELRLTRGECGDAHTVVSTGATRVCSG